MTISKLPLKLSTMVLLAFAAQLLWEHTHGGILVHHLMHKASLPGISNLWGLLVLPLLAGWTGWRIQRRLDAGEPIRPMLLGALVALAVSLLLSAGFVSGVPDLSLAALITALLLALFLPGYRAECWLAWVLGMCFVFGAVIPTVIGGVLSAVSACMHLALRPAWRRLRAR